MHKSLFLFIIILFFAIILRFQGVFTNSFAFTYDVGRDLLAVQEIFLNGKLPLIGQTTGFPGLFYGPWWYYSLIPMYIISFGNPTGIAFFMALSGLLTVFFGYFFAKSINKNINLALIFSSFLAVSPVVVGISTQIWNPNVAPFYIILLIIVLSNLYSVSEKRKNVRVFSSLGLGFIGGLILDSEIVFGILFLAGIFFSLITSFRNKIKIYEFSLIFIGFFTTLLPRIIFELRHDFLMTNSILRFISDNLISAQSVSVFNPQKSLIALFMLWNSTLALENLYLGIFLMLITVYGMMLFYKEMNNKEKVFLKMSFFIFFAFIFGLSFFPGDIWGHYTVGLPVIYILIFSLIIFKFIEKFKKINFLIIFFLLILVLLNINLPQLINNVKNPFWQGDVSLYRNQINVLDYIYKNAKGKEFNYLVYTPPIFDYTYKYLFSWYGKNKYGYIPSLESEKMLYIILEPDNQYPERIKDWLNIRKEDGKIANEIVLDGGIKLQIRNR